MTAALLLLAFALAWVWVHPRPHGGPPRTGTPRRSRDEKEGDAE